MPSTPRFPAPVREAMTASGAAATCIPVELDGGAPEAAFFINLAGPESKADRRVIRKWRGPLSLGLDSDVIETAHGAVVVLRPEVHTGPFDPFVCEILATPGEGGAHFEALELLSRQPRLTWFFGDRGFEIIRTQQHPLDDGQRGRVRGAAEEGAAPRRDDPDDRALRRPRRPLRGGEPLHAAHGSPKGAAAGETGELSAPACQPAVIEAWSPEA